MSNILNTTGNKVYGENSDIQRALIPTGADPNEKIYLILYQCIDINEEVPEENRYWEIKQGRQATYEYLRDLVIAEAIDPNNSYILAETVTMQDMGTVIGFLEAMRDDNLVVEDTDFDPYDYDIEYDDSEEDEEDGEE